MAALSLFNDEGEQHVTTNHIADEVNISPGNLYYHFRNKEDIIGELFQAYADRMQELLATADEREFDLEEIWLLLHLVFETIWEYRFIHRNLVDLSQRISNVRIQMGYIISGLQQAVCQLCKPLIRDGIMDASDQELSALATNVVVITAYWLNFSSIPTHQNTGQNQMSQGAYQVLSIVAPYLREPERGHLSAIASSYQD